MSELYHECGVAAVYHLPNRDISPLAPMGDPDKTSQLISRLLLDIQNRGQLAAGMTTFNPARNQLIDTHKDVGTVTEVFQLNHQDTFNELMRKYQGPAAIGHVRYATCGKDDRSYAQPFERHHIQKSKWFSFGFNGQLANYQQLCQEFLNMDILGNLSKRLDGAYNIVFLDALGNMFVSRDPNGIRPLCYAFDGSLFAAASESVALANMGFDADEIYSLPPGSAVLIQNGQLSIREYAKPTQTSHCFFEWIYFANVCSTLDDQSVYITRKRLGEELAEQETVTIDEDTIVVPVPDTAKAAADSMAYHLSVPCLEGLIRNRYIGRTFIEGANRGDKVRAKYTPLPEVLEGKRVLLVEDTIVRSTTMKALISQLKERGRAREVHVRVACPPIIGPCFYGIDMSTINELFAPRFLNGGEMSPEVEQAMADAIGADSLKYLPKASIARAIGLPATSLCQACIDTTYPTEAGRQMYQLAVVNSKNDQGDDDPHRTYDVSLTTPVRS